MKTKEIGITAPDFRRIQFTVTGTAPYVQLAFSEKAMNMMAEKMEAGDKAKKGKARAARDWESDYKGAMHETESGLHGIPATAFRKALISACRLVNFKMTLAKLALFVEADGIDRVEGQPLVYIDGSPEMVRHHVRNATGVADLRVRAMWRKWSAIVTIKYDADLFTAEEIANLMARAGEQVGIGEGRPDSRTSAGMGWGTFTIASQE